MVFFSQQWIYRIDLTENDIIGLDILSDSLQNLIGFLFVYH